MCPNTRSSRSPTGAVSSSSCFSAIFRFRWLAMVSASLVGSSMPFSETSTSGAIFLFSLMYCSNWLITVRPSASSSLLLGVLVGHRLGKRLEIRVRVLEAGDLRPAAALDQHLHRAVRQLQQLQDRGDGADAEDVVGCRVVLGGVLLRDQQDLLVLLHDRLERADRLLAADEQRDDHVREHDDVAQRQHRQRLVPARAGGLPGSGMETSYWTVSGRAPNMAQPAATMGEYPSTSSISAATNRPSLETQPDKRSARQAPSARSLP